MLWIIIGILMLVFIVTILKGGDKEDAIENTMFTGMLGASLLWNLFWTGASIFFFIFVVRACFG